VRAEQSKNLEHFSFLFPYFLFEMGIIRIRGPNMNGRMTEWAGLQCVPPSLAVAARSTQKEKEKEKEKNAVAARPVRAPSCSSLAPPPHALAVRAGKAPPPPPPSAVAQRPPATSFRGS
jgi:hypothetical protein